MHFTSCLFTDRYLAILKLSAIKYKLVVAELTPAPSSVINYNFNINIPRK